MISVLRITISLWHWMRYIFNLLSSFVYGITVSFQSAWQFSLSKSIWINFEITILWDSIIKGERAIQTQSIYRFSFTFDCCKPIFKSNNFVAKHIPSKIRLFGACSCFVKERGARSKKYKQKKTPPDDCLISVIYYSTRMSLSLNHSTETIPNVYYREQFLGQGRVLSLPRTVYI